MFLNINNGCTVAQSPSQTIIELDKNNMESIIELYLFDW